MAIRLKCIPCTRYMYSTKLSVKTFFLEDTKKFQLYAAKELLAEDEC